MRSQSQHHSDRCDFPVAMVAIWDPLYPNLAQGFKVRVIQEQRDLQLGLPADKAQYIHRVGRTARAGKRGRSALLLSDFEAPYFLRQLRDVSVTPAPPLPERAATALQVRQSFG